MDRDLYDAAVRIVDMVDASPELRNTPLKTIYPSLVKDLKAKCPGFAEQEYKDAMEMAFKDMR